MATLAQLAFGPNVSGAIARGTETRTALAQADDADRRRVQEKNIDRLFSGGIPDDPAQRQTVEQKAFALGGADVGLQVRELFQGMDAADREEAAREGRVVATVLAGVQDQSTYDRARAGLQSQGIDISTLPEQFDPAHRDFVVNSARELEDVLKGQQPGEGFTLGKDQVRFGPSGTEIARGPTTPAPAPGGSPADQFKNANTLRDEFVNQTKGFVEAQQGLARVEVGAAQDSGQGDVALIFGFMKTIDPTSTVREGEFATAENTGSVGQQLVGIYNKILTGDRLTPEQRQGFVDAARAQFETSRTAYDGTVAEYDRLAREFGLDPALVIINRVVSQSTGAQGGGAQGQLTPDAISRMTVDQLPSDVSGLSPEQRQALDRRLTELGF